MNTTDNQVTAQVKAEPTVAKTLLLQLRLKASKNKHVAVQIHAALLAKVVRANKQLVKVKVQHANAVLQILAQVRMVAVLIRLAVQIHVAMPNKVKVKNAKLAKLVHRVVKIHVIRVLIMVAMVKMVRTAIITAQITVLQVGIIKRNKWN